MGFGKVFKKAVKNVVSGAKGIVKDPTNPNSWVAGAGAALAPATGGVSLALTERAGSNENKMEELRRKGGRAQSELENERNQMQGAFGYSSMSDLIKAKKRKEGELAENEETKVTGISSLIGRGKTLG